VKKIVTIAALAFAFAMPPKVTLEFKLNKGQVYSHVITAESTIKQTVMGQEMLMNTASRSTMSYSLKDGDGTPRRYEVWYQNIENSMGMMGMDQRFSSDTASLPMVDPMSSLMAQLVDKRFDVAIAPSGDVVSISGINEVLEAYKQSQGGLSDDVLQQVTGTFGESGMRSNLNGTVSIFPGRAVKTGESWVKESNGNSEMPTIVKTTYTLKSILGDNAELTVAGTITTDPANAQAKINGMDAVYFLEGKRSGTLTVEVATGWIRQGTLEDEISGSITISPDPAAPTSIIVPVEVKTTTRIKG
jgi:hypothetical protein